ncbi:MAG: recombinase family protein [Victivallaceae bacterium]
MPEQTPIKRCAIYTRKSVEDETDMEFNSIEAQREAGEAYIASQKANGWQVIPERYDDYGWSGGNINRPALKQLLNDAGAGKIDIIVVYKIDRLSRSICDFAELTKKLDKWNVALVAVTQEINTSTSAGRMMLNILITFAQYEREIISERVRDKMSATRRKGKWAGGAVPLGYQLENHKLIIEPEGAATILRIFKRFLEIQSPKLIAMELAQKGIKTRNGVDWTTQRIYGILNNHTYVGEVNYKGEIYAGEHEGIVSREMWDLAHQYMRENAPRSSTVRRIENLSPLGGILRCGHCNCAMTPSFTRKNGRKYCFYVCIKDARLPNSDCPVKRVPAGEIEKLVFQQMVKLLQMPEIVASVARQAELQPNVILGKFSTNLWEQMTQGERQRLSELMLNKVEINYNDVCIEFRTAGMKEAVKEHYENQG